MKVLVKTSDPEWVKSVVEEELTDALFVDDLDVDIDLAILGIDDYPLLEKIYHLFPLCYLILDAGNLRRSNIPTLPVPVRNVVSSYYGERYP